MRQTYKKIIDSAKNIYGKRREGGSAACRYGVFRAVFGVSGLSEENLEAGLEAVEVGA